MSRVTIRVLDGFEMGALFENLPAPVTIGRERENQISLNDEQVSRFHAKIQDADGRLILTDLESTNGTRVNGRPARLRVLQPGDQIQIGRSVLLVDPPAETGVTPRPQNASDRHDDDGFEVGRATQAANFDQLAYPAGMPRTPEHLKTLQIAELADCLGWIHDQLTRVLTSAEECDDEPPSMAVPPEEWHRLQACAFLIGQRIRDLTSPGDR
jgi:hypothetical protein